MSSPRAPRPGILVHRPVRAHPRPVPATPLTAAAPPTAGWASSPLAGWLQYLVPLAGSGGSIAFLFAVPGPRPAWLVALVIAAAVASVAAGLALRLVERRTARRARRRYLAHLTEIARRADHLAAAQLAVADHLHPDPPKLWAIVERTDRLWERRPTDADFLTVRIGRGRVPLTAPARLDLGHDPLAEHDPELLLAVRELVRRATWLPGAPVPIPLRDLGVLALTGPPVRARALARAIVCELAAFHAPDDLRILAAYPSTARSAWQWMRWLPHTRDPTLATTPASAGQPARLLAQTQAELNTLLGRLGGRPVGASPGQTRPHVVAILDMTEPLDADPPEDTNRTPPAGRAAHGAAIGGLLENPGAAGATVIWLARTISGEPSELSARIRLDGRGSSTLQETAPGGRLVAGIRPDAADPSVCEALARRMAPLRLDSRPTTTAAGPVRLLDLLDRLGPGTASAGPVPRPRDRAELLRVPIGVTPDGNPVVLDLKEAAEAGIGPHGLVVGATGSGKSELLRTIVAGLAATHPPDQLAFVLVDFKGGAAFADLAPLPQVAGLITNLQADLSMVDRAMAALQGELARRQRLLHQAGNQPDLRAYAASRAADPWLEPLPYLLIVVDEFGELLAARPEFLDLFTAIGRVGRSLGMHLLLASQRLDEGRLRGLDSHLRFRICLRTFSAAESTAVLGVPDAYHLPAAPGSALLKADAGPPVRFAAARIGSGPPHPPRSGTGFGADLEVLLGGLVGTGLPVHQVWLPALAPEIALDPLLEPVGGWLEVPVGVVDRPIEQDQGPLVLDLSRGAGHLVVVGAPRSGKSTLLCTLVAALAATHPPDEVQVYALDLGGGLLHRLRDLPHVGAVCGPREHDRVRRLIRELRSLLVEREHQFRELGVDSMAAWHARRRDGADLGDHGEVFLVIDNWGALARELPELEPEVTELTALGLHYGVHVALTANRWAEVRPGLRENLGGRLELRLNDPLESEVGRMAAAGLPDLPGRGLTQSGLQFQTALPGSPPAILDRARAAPGGGVAPPLRLLPALVEETALTPAGEARGGPASRDRGSAPAPRQGSRAGAGRPEGLPFAVEEHRLEVVGLDLFGGSPHLLVFGDAGCGKSSLLRLIAKGTAARSPATAVGIVVVDPRRGLADLAALPNVVGYACTTTAVAEVVDWLRQKLEDRMAAGRDLVSAPVMAAWTGARTGLPVGPRSNGRRPPEGAFHLAAHPLEPRYLLLVDDYDLLPSTGGSPLLPLLDLLGLGREVGLHLVLARRVAGAARAGFEPVVQRLRELGGPGLVMCGDPGEGAIAGGQRAAALPPGRGFYVHPPHGPTLVQVAYCPPLVEGRTAPADGG